MSVTNGHLRECLDRELGEMEQRLEKTMNKSLSKMEGKLTKVSA